MKKLRLDACLWIAGYAVAAGLAWLTVRAEIDEQSAAAAAEAARVTALAIEADLDRIERQVAWLLRPGGEATQTADTAFMLATTPPIVGLRFVDGHGRAVYAATRTGFVRDTSDLAHTRAVLSADPDRPWMSPVRRIAGGPHADLALMRRNDSAVAIAELDLAFFGDTLDAASAAPGTRFALIDEAGTSIVGALDPDHASLVPIPRADWLLGITPPSAPLPLRRVVERFAAFASVVAAAAWLMRRLRRAP